MTIPVVKKEVKGLFVDLGRWDSPGQFKGKPPEAEDKTPKPTAEKPKEGK